MGVLMKIIFSLFLFISFLYSNQYTFLVKKYDKEIELEAKIIDTIAVSVVRKDIKLYIPEITELEENVYSEIFQLTKTCNTANFIFVKKNINDENLCPNSQKIYFTNNYQKLLVDKKYIGAFFWSKSRPNIVFIKDRLDQRNIILPKEYNQFVEDL